MRVRFRLSSNPISTTRPSTYSNGSIRLWSRGMGRVFVLGLSQWMLLFGLMGCSGEGDEEDKKPISILEALAKPSAASSEGYARVMGPVPFSFPKDHGPHDDHQIEWWYFTGNLSDPSGDAFGFQLTFFRTGLNANSKPRKSEWAARNSWMAHFTVTNADGRSFHCYERFARGAMGLAGASASPFSVRTLDWSAESVGESLFPLRLRAQGEEAAVDLILNRSLPPTLQGERGYSPKGPEPGNASHYVSFTRCAAHGSVTSKQQRSEVQGQVWIDHEWSTSVLGDDLAGWDWFSLHLEDGRDLMLYFLRRKDGSASPFSSGTLIEQDGRSRTLSLEDFSISVQDQWTSPETKATYPSKWEVKVPKASLSFQVTPLIPHQELRLAVAYWEGAVAARSASGALIGRGYVELVGYVEAAK